MIAKITVLMEIGDRPNQEDAVNINGRVIQLEHHLSTISTENLPLLLVLCDGMGGHAFGEKASLWTAEAANRLIDASSAREAMDTLYLIQKASEKELPPDTGTTIAFCLINQKGLIAGNAGDSRVYGIKDQSIFRITHDHSVVQELVDSGEISTDEAMRHPLRNLITLGIGPAFSKEWTSPKKAYVVEMEQIPDYLLLCSDGLCDNLTDEEILEHVLLFQDDAPKELFLSARERTRYLDNVSIILASLK